MDQIDDASPSDAHGTSQSSSFFSRRRKSLPSRSHSSNPSTVDPASPEVISSLISSLSTISKPLQTHFDSVPRIGSHTTPSSPGFLETEPFEELSRRPVSEYNATSGSHGFGMTYGGYKSFDETAQNPFLHPDDAAAAPVVRMARAPSSAKSKNSIKAEASLARPTSTGSYASSKVALGEEGSAFGMISSEPGPRVSTANSIASTSSRKSLKNQFGLLKKASREFGSDKDKKAERLRKTSSYNDSLKHNIPRSRASLRSMHSMADLAEEGRPSSVAMTPHEEDVPSTPSRGDLSPLPATAEAASTTTPGGIGSGRLIPTRESSLRHSYSSSSKKHRSARHSRYSSRGSKDLKIDKGILEAGVEAEQVTKRIQELKDQQQKIKSELETDNSPARATRAPPVRPTRISRAQSDRDVDLLMQESTTDFVVNFDESAPSPAVMTGKTRSKPRTGTPLASKPPNLQPLAVRDSLEKQDQFDRSRPRRSMEPSTPLSVKSHRRISSGPVSPGRASIGEERPSSADSIDHAVFDYVSSPKLTRKVPHPATGRMIAFSDVGDPKGHVVLCCLGMGLTRYLMAFYDELARTLNLRLITLDRPGVGESGPYLDESGTPLNWPDDVAIVCNHIKVTKFSILAHSAGAIYALATALRIPQHIRGRIHLLAPWIPPSQLSSIGTLKEPVPTNAVPYSQRILRALPTSLLKVANSSFMSATSASITTSLPKSPRRSKRKSAGKDTTATPSPKSNNAQRVDSKIHQQGDDLKALQNLQAPVMSKETNTRANPVKQEAVSTASLERERQIDYDNRLTHKIWELATTNANPAVDLLICLERRQAIGFRYVDITRAVVIHHGSRDTRVPVDNVRWLGKMMRRCEVRVLEGEGHGLMASATVMGNVLTEIAKEWEAWTTVVQGRRRATINNSARSGITLQASS